MNINSKSGGNLPSNWWWQRQGIDFFFFFLGITGMLQLSVELGVHLSGKVRFFTEMCLWKVLLVCPPMFLGV